MPASPHDHHFSGFAARNFTPDDVKINTGLERFTIYINTMPSRSPDTMKIGLEQIAGHVIYLQQDCV
jgi:hypothetical protein